MPRHQRRGSTWRCSAPICSRRGEQHLRDYKQLLDDYVAAAPSSREIAQEIDANVNDGHLYDGLKICRRLLAHEHEVLAHVH